jgi:hypothetical protein
VCVCVCVRACVCACVHLAIKASRAEECRVEDIGAVRARKDNDAGEGVKTVHLDQQLVKRVFALVVAAGPPPATRSADSIDLIDEDDARGLRTGLAKEVAHARCTYAHEHLNEVRARNGKEGHIRLPRHGLGEQCFARARGAAQERTLGDFCAEAFELIRVAQKLYELHHFNLGLMQPRDVLERGLAL